MKRLLLSLFLFLLVELCAGQAYKLEFSLSMYDYSVDRGCTEYQDIKYSNNLQYFSNLNSVVYTSNNNSSGYAIFNGEVPATVTFTLEATENFYFNCNPDWSDGRSIALNVTPSNRCGEDEVTDQTSYTGLLLKSTITPVINAPTLSTTSSSACANEKITLSTNAGFGGYIWEVFDGSIYREFSRTSGNVSTFNLVESFPDSYTILLGKTLYFRVRNVECNFFSSLSKPLTVYPPIAKPTSIVPSEPKCKDGYGFITLSNFVGAGDLKVSYVGSDKIPSKQEPINSDPYNIPNLLPGKYIISITNGVCADTFGVTVPPAPLPVTVPSVPTVTHSTCIGQSATVSVTAERGNGDYTYTLFGGSSPISNKTGFFTIGTAGTYYIEATDRYNCKPAITGNFEIKIPPAISFTTTVVQPSGYGKSDGKISVIVDSPIKDFTYEYQLIDNGGWQPANTFTGLAEGQYWVQVRTSGSCISEPKEANLVAPKQLSLSVDKVTHETCKDGRNGSVEVSGVGGTSGYVYSLDNRFTNHNATGKFTDLAAGKHTIYVKDSNQITASTEVTINPGAVITVTVSKTNATCSDLTDGTITVTASGGTEPYTYSLDGVTFQPGNIFRNRGAGNYTVTVKDKNGCTASIPVSIDKPGPVSIEVKSTKDVACQGSATGSVTLAASGGTSTGYQFSVNGTDYQASPSFSGLPGGDYVATVKDSNGCTTSIPFKIGEPTVSLLLAEDKSLHKDISCFNGRDGVVVVSSSGGTGTVKYLISSSPVENTTGKFTGLAVGKHIITAIDDNKCSTSIEVELTQPADLAFITTEQRVSCFSKSDGGFTVTAIGGTKPYRFSIDNGTSYQSSNVFSGLAAGTYTVIVNDINDCEKSGTFTVTQPQDLTLSITSAKAISCYNGNDGQLQVKVTGGTAPYTYSLNGGAVSNATGLFENLTAGVHLISIKDAKGCEYTVSHTLTQPSQPLNAALSMVTPTYFGASNGEITVTASGGTSPYTYAINRGAFQSGNKFTNLPAGNYTLAVKDAKGCVWEQTVQLQEPSALTMTVALQQGISCHGASDGVIKITVDGGVGPYLFSLNGGQAVSDPLFTNLAAGVYSISVTDSKGVAKTSGYTLTQPGAIAATYTTTPVSCYNGSNGNIEVRATGGTGTLRYSRNGIDFQSSNIFEGLQQGSYTIYIRDEKGCTVSSAPQVITQPQLLTLSWRSTSNVSCTSVSDGSITVEPRGGNGSYRYSINNGPTQTSSTFNGLQAGLYQIVVTDEKGCQSASLEVEVAEPANPLAVQDIIKTDALCKGGNTGSIQVAMTGGTAPYTFTLNGGSPNSTGRFDQLRAGTYTLAVRDSKGCTVTSTIAVQEPEELGITTSKRDINCYGEASGSISITATGGVAPYRYSLNGSPFQTSNSFSGLAANTYAVKVKDANGCEISSTETLVNKYASLTLTLDANPPLTCNDKGSIEVASVSGGRAPYTYSLDGVNFSSNKFFADLSAGDYTVFVKDASGCISTATISPYGPVAIRATLVPAHITCFGGRNGSIQVQNATGGSGSYQYSIDGVNFQSSPSFSGLSKGTYTILVRDQPYSCQSSFTVTLTEPTQLTLTADLVQDVSCFNGQDGAIRILAAGGTAPYAYAINGKLGSSAHQFENLPAGDHVMVVTDSKGCVATGIVTVKQPAPLAIAGVQVQGANCFGGKDGSIHLQASGGTQPYKYLISGRPEQASHLFADLQAGSYTIKVTDARGCQLDYAVTVAEPEVLVTIVKPTMISCQGGADGAINLTAQGGAAPYRYSITNGASFSSNSSFTGLAAGTYRIVVADQNNCTWAGEVTLTEPAGITWTSSTKEISCFGGSDGEIVIEATGGTGALSYSLDNGAWVNKGIFGNLPAGRYTIRIKDSSECFQEFSVSLTQPEKLKVALLSKLDVSCHGGSDGGMITSISGGTQPYSMTLNGRPVTGTRFEELSKSSYTLIVTDSKGCVDQMVVSIEEPAALSLKLVSKQDINCFGDANGVISVTAAGGAAPYMYSLNNSGYASASVFSSLAPGSYQVSVKDANGCVQTIQTILSQPDAPLSLKVVSKKDVSCKDGTDGILEMSAEGGTPGYRYYINGNEISSALASGLAAGTYRIEVKDAKGCIAQAVAIIGQPSAMGVTSNLKNPVCFNDCSGEIALTVQGGTAPYTYTWLGNPGFGNNAIVSNLCSGIYRVRVTDAQGCSIEQQFELHNPAEIPLTGIQDTVLCKGQQAVFHAGNPGAQYLWSSDNGFSSTQSSVTITEGGNYQVKVTNAAGCSVTKAFTVTVSTSLLKADFLMASVANLGDTLFVVDVSKPTPSNTAWAIPPGAKIVGSNPSGTIKQIVFDAPGSYTTQMRVSLGGCTDVIEKTITILPKGQTAEVKDALGYQEELIKKLILYPNPTSGYFSVLTELSQKQDITLQLIDFNQNKVIELKEEKGSDKYTSVFSHPELAPGVYILSLKVGKEVRTLKVVKI